MRQEDGIALGGWISKNTVHGARVYRASGTKAWALTVAARDGQTRRELLDAAIACFSTEGYAATSLTDIGRRAEVTRGAVYHHFEGKAQLFEAVFDQLERELRLAGLPADMPVER